MDSGVISANGFRYPYFCYEDDRDTLLFNGGRGSPCFALIIRPYEREAVLVSLMSSTKCSLDPGATTKSAGKAAFALAKERGVTRIEFTDNSTKRLPTGKQFSLADMSFLTTGATWYESFLPVQLKDEALALKLPQWRRIVKTNTWEAVLACLKRYYPAIDIIVNTYNLDISDIDTSAPGSAMAVLQRIKRRSTSFFADYQEKLLECSGIESLHGKSWIGRV